MITKTKSKIWYSFCPCTAEKGVAITWSWGRLVLARKVIYRDIDGSVHACFCNSSEEVIER